MYLGDLLFVLPGGPSREAPVVKGRAHLDLLSCRLILICLPYPHQLNVAAVLNTQVRQS